MIRLGFRGWLLPLALWLLLLSLPVAGISLSTARLIETAAVFALLISGFNLTFGFAGELAFSQVFLFAAGGYAAGYLAVREHNADLLISLPVVALIVAGVSIFVGFPGLRLGSLYVTMVSLFLIQVFPNFLEISSRYTGGLYGIPLPSVATLQLDSTTFYLAVLTVAAVWFAAMRNLIISRHGTALHVLRASPILAQSLGIGVLKLRMTAYVLGGIPAGIAGAIFAYMNTLVFPVDLSSALFMLAGSVIGGSASVYGAVFGATVVEIVPYIFLAVSGYYDILLGVLLLVVCLALPEGAAGMGNDLLRRIRTRPAAPPFVPPVSRTPFTLGGRDLVVRSVSRRFGGVKALDDVTLRAATGQITAIVGPNGSGKTTLLNLISGFVRPDSGSVTAGADDLTYMSPQQVARSGVGRSFQTPILPPIPVLEVVSAARFVRPYVGILPTVLRLPRFRRVRDEDRSAALGALALVRAVETYDQLASTLSAGSRRLVEVARVLVGQPSIILLDEPTAGLAPEEIAPFADLVRDLRARGATVVLVEHNLPFVLSVADVIHVMSDGRVIASGPPNEIVQDPAAKFAYLGTTQPSL